MTTSRLGYVWPIALIVILSGCQEPSVVQQRGSTKDMYPDHESWDSSIIISRNGLMVSVAESEQMIRYSDRNIANLIGQVDVDFYDEQGLHMSQLSADSAEINTQTSTMSAFGQVVIRSDSGLVLETATLRWDDKYKMLATNDTVLFTTSEGDTLRGIGFESDVDLTHWKIYQPWGVTERGLYFND